MTSTAEALAEPSGGFDASVDYLTQYWSEDDAERFPETSLIKRINAKIREGHQEQYRESHGIQWRGAAGCWIGHRAGERFHRASGQVSAETFAETAHCCTSHSRLDLAYTTSESRPRRGLAARTYEEHSRLPDVPNQPRKRQLIQNNELGQTFSLGSRTSEVYLRLYDFGVAHDCAPAGCRWRYEVELKGRAANSSAALLLSETQRTLAIAALVRTMFTDRRVEFPVLLPDKHIVICPREKSTAEKKMAWLEKQVRPAVGKLVEAGYLAAALDALGLTELVTINPPQP